MGNAFVIISTSGHNGRARSNERTLTLVRKLCRKGAQFGFDETIAVVSNLEEAAGLVEDATVLVDEAAFPTELSAARVAIDFCSRAGYSGILLALVEHLDPVVAQDVSWTSLLQAERSPIVVATVNSRSCGLIFLDAESWPLLPLDGSLEALWRLHPEFAAHVELVRGDGAYGSHNGPTWDPPSTADIADVTQLLGRKPLGNFRVVVRDRSNSPVVIENAPFLADGTPMPTRFWLVGSKECHAVGQLESTGGNQAAEEAIDAATIVATHERYAAARDELIPTDHKGPRPTGGVGGTRVGVKCLHAHLANYLAGGGDCVGRWVATMLNGRIEGPVAAIDCGTNSTRLLILDRAGEPVERHMIITRLGQDVDRTGELANAAIERTLVALRSYRSVMDDYGVTAVRSVATSAARDARNSEEFFSSAEAVLGVRPVLLAGEEEGRLSYKGATVGLSDSEGPYLVVDVGGGSTELVAGRSTGDDDPAVISLPIGCVRVTERFFETDPVDSLEREKAAEYVSSVIESALSEIPGLRVPQKMVGVAGTVATLVTLDLGDDHYDASRAHHRTLSRKSIDSLLDELAGESTDERRHHPGIEPNRANVIVGGALVIAEVLRIFGHDEMIYSESDVLDGVARDLYDQN